MDRTKTMAATLGAALLVGCYGATGPVKRPISELRSMKSGVCAEVAIDSAAATFVTEGRMRRRIDTCLRTGRPGTLFDDGTTPLITTTVYGDANSPDADANNWQVETWFNAAPMGKRMMSKSGLTPELSCDATSGCESWSLDIMQWPQPFGPGTYVFRYTFGLDVSRVVTNTITLQ